MAGTKTRVLKRYDSAYPGSMFEREYGDYVELSDYEDLEEDYLNLLQDHEKLKEKIADIFREM
jgi:hypothetical protein